ncbi:unnamed protein product [marine sediment metagenome]|uniref:Cation efflux protein transmembrane domain-containing protein n=1 Tax=marine sediment metagenome TaxID=412755 RepID=X1I8Q8_9ZZZZ
MFTVVYNVIEGIVSLVFGGLAGSAALVGFGIDSFVESLSGGVMIWRFTRGTRLAGVERERIERKATRLVGITFFILAAYVLYESATSLLLNQPPGPSLPGIIIAIVSLVVMPVLFIVKRRTARKLNSPSLAADSKQTLACSMLSIALLVGLGLNYLFGFWQADPLVGLLVVGYLVREGWNAVRKQELCTC